ncbi:MAG: hypothetical protein QOI63_1796, partial [Thermoplasmata archaeon]|nr:hypothetical protein [Thermoplasmata archaeon]
GTRQDYFGAAALDGRAWLAWTEEGFVVPAAPLALPA